MVSMVPEIPGAFTTIEVSGTVVISGLTLVITLSFGIITENQV